jgi:hypothetical protein
MDRLTLDARTLLVAARAVGLVVAAGGDRLSVSGPRGAAGLARLLLEQKAGILAALATEAAGGSGPARSRSAAPAIADAADPYQLEERAAIREYDGGMTRQAAERLAFPAISGDGKEGQP